MSDQQRPETEPRSEPGTIEDRLNALSKLQASPQVMLQHIHRDVTFMRAMATDEILPAINQAGEALIGLEGHLLVGFVPKIEAIVREEVEKSFATETARLHRRDRWRIRIGILLLLTLATMLVLEVRDDGVTRLLNAGRNLGIEWLERIEMPANLDKSPTSLVPSPKLSTSPIPSASSSLSTPSGNVPEQDSMEPAESNWFDQL